jgi:hypothetical protein
MNLGLELYILVLIASSEYWINLVCNVLDLWRKSNQKNPEQKLGIFAKYLVYNYLTIALNSDPALKVTTFIAGILIFCEGF